MAMATPAATAALRATARRVMGALAGRLATEAIAGARAVRQAMAEVRTTAVVAVGTAGGPAACRARAVAGAATPAVRTARPATAVDTLPEVIPLEVAAVVAIQAEAAIPVAAIPVTRVVVTPAVIIREQSGLLENSQDRFRHGC
jgi:hypothetical protein